MKTLFLSLLFSVCASSAALANPAASLYDLEQSWTTQGGKPMPLKDLKGHAVVTTMVFTSCPGACPMMVNDMKHFDEQLSPAEKKEVRYVLFSIDPKRDTPEALQKFAQKMKLDERWTLLTSTPEQARELAAALGFSYKDLGGGDFTHSSSLFLLSKSGEILSKKERKFDWTEFLKKLRQ